MSSLRRRALVVLATGSIVLGGAIAVAPTSSAHACVGLVVTGTTIAGCHTPPNPSGHLLCPNAGNGNTYVMVCTV